MGTIISSTPPAKILSIFKPDGFEAVTGTTANTLTGSVLIPANSVAVNFSCAELTVRAIKTGVVGIATLRVYVNTTDSLSGATLLATGGAPGATDLYQQLDRTMFIGKSPTNTKVAPSTSALFSDNARSTAAESNVVIDWAVDQYIILAIQNASTLDTSTGSGIIFKIYK
jgi:hypothetical protein